MRDRAVIRVVDARAGQGRVILHLDCRHNVGIPTSTLEETPRLRAALQLHDAPAGVTVPPLNVWPCTACPDPTPAEARREKSATQLWKEAGEP